MTVTDARIAIIATDWFEEPELLVPRDRLREAGATVTVHAPADVAGGDSPTIQAVSGDTEPTQKVPVDGTVEDLDAASIDALVVPGGTVNADRLRGHQPAQRLVQEMLDAGKPVAVICHGPWLLVSAGVTEGRRLTSFASLRDDLVNAGAQWVDEPVVVDGSLITSRDPDDLPVFVDALLAALDEPTRAERSS